MRQHAFFQSSHDKSLKVWHIYVQTYIFLDVSLKKNWEDLEFIKLTELQKIKTLVYRPKENTFVIILKNIFEFTMTN